jgi:transcriptional regulator with XRE-family HTH domain
MTDTFGARLRRERERRQITLAEIAARTKIKASLFEELERDDASHWPAGIFRRSFMRAYAVAVGLDADAAVREFLERFPDPADPPAPASAADVPPIVLQEPVPVTAPVAVARVQHSFRLTLVETGLPFTGGRILADARKRWAAAAWDLGSLVAIALTIFMFMDAFWMPFGVTALCYYVGGVLLLGNSPGVCLFAPQPAGLTTGGSRPTRVVRARAGEPVRAAEATFGPAAFGGDRRREVRG